MTSHEKTAPVAATTETAHENIPNRSHDDSTVSYAHFEDRGKSTGIDYATLSGAKLPKNESFRLIVPIDAVRRMYAGETVPMILNPDCVQEHERRYFEKQRRKAAEERRQAEREARSKHERDVIEQITGERLAKADLVEYRILELYRDGADVTPWLEALKVLDDEALAAAGLTSWGDLDDDEELEGEQ